MADSLYQRGRNWFKGLGQSYSSAADQAKGLGSELRNTGQMMNYADQALHPSSPDIAAPTSSWSGDRVNPNYKPIGGQNALNQALRSASVPKGFSSVRRTQSGSSVGSMRQR